MQQELTRREALKRGAMTASALAWATPVMQVVGMSPALAQETSPGAEDCCIGADGKPAKLKSLTMKYLGGTNFCPDGPPYPFTQKPTLVTCTDFLDPNLDTLPVSVYIVASHQGDPFASDGTPKPAARIWFEGAVSQGTPFLIDAGYATETVLKGQTWVHVFSADPSNNESFEDLYLQKVAFHTSCSEPLFTGDVFGSVEVVGCESEDAEATTLEPAAETQELEGTEELDGTETSEPSEGSVPEGEAETPGSPGTGQGTVLETPAEPPGDPGAPGDDSESGETAAP